MSKILQTHPKSVQAHHDIIMQCLDDKDESIRLRALDLLSGMVKFIFQSCKEDVSIVLGIEKKFNGCRT
jgi:hypothetical protein